MRPALALIAAALIFAPVSIAQQTPKPIPPTKPAPPVKPAPQTLVAPKAPVAAGVLKIEPDVTAQLKFEPSSKAASIDRKMNLLQTAKVTIPGPAAVREPMLLSVQAPLNTSLNAALSFFNLADYRPAQNVAVMKASTANSDQSWVVVAFPTAPDTRYIVDCVIPLGRSIKFSWYEGSGDSRVRRDSTVPVDSSRRAAVVLPPLSGYSGYGVYVQALEGWQFQSCEVTPVG